MACQAPLSTEFSRQEYYNGLPFPPAGNLPDPGIKTWSPALQGDSLPFELPGKPTNFQLGQPNWPCISFVMHLP